MSFQDGGVDGAKALLAEPDPVDHEVDAATEKWPDDEDDENQYEKKPLESVGFHSVSPRPIFTHVPGGVKKLRMMTLQLRLELCAG